MKRALFLVLAITSLLAACGAPTATPPTTPALTPTPPQSSDMNLLLLGTDKRSASAADWRTDTLIVVAIRPGQRIIAMLSIPRDLWVDIPGYGPERINAADYMGESRNGAGGGPALLAATLQENLGIGVHGYARIDFAGLERIIDAVGGVDIDVPRAFDEWMDEGEGTPPAHVKIAPGPQHLDGRTALQYARSRRGTTDMDRSQRQQQVLLALRGAAVRPETLPRLPGLMGALAGTVETNLRPADAMALLNTALRIQPQDYRTRVFDDSMVRNWVTPDGAMVLLPDRARIAQVWAEMAQSAQVSPIS